MKTSSADKNKPFEDKPPRRAGVTRRTVLKIGALVGVSLPLIVTLRPIEARAQGTDGS